MFGKYTIVYLHVFYHSEFSSRNFCQISFNTRVLCRLSLSENVNSLYGYSREKGNPDLESGKIGMGATPFHVGTLPMAYDFQEYWDPLYGRLNLEDYGEPLLKMGIPSVADNVSQEY